MDKSRIFIASSGRTLVLAEKVRDELAMDFCQATVWTEAGRLQPGFTIIEMLEGAAKQYDFSVIILAKDDILTSGDRQVLKARDNCVFEAGLFMAAIGRKRCFLLNSVASQELPSDLGGIISIPFEEPTDLLDRQACAEAIRGAAAQLKDIVQKAGTFPKHAALTLLSVDELFRREQPISEGGDLQAGNVVVSETQPWAELSRPIAVRRNIDCGISYQYFFFFSDDTIEKICQSLQVIAWAGITGATAGRSDFNARVDTVQQHKDQMRATTRPRRSSPGSRRSTVSVVS